MDAKAYARAAAELNYYVTGFRLANAGKRKEALEYFTKTREEHVMDTLVQLNVKLQEYSKRAVRFTASVQASAEAFAKFGIAISELSK